MTTNGNADTATNGSSSHPSPDTTKPNTKPAMAADDNAVCLCTTEHRPPVLMFEQHHIWPLGMGGPNTKTNKVWLCPNAHYNTHELLRLMVKALRPLTDYELQQVEDRPVSRYAAKTARNGFIAWAKATGLIVDE